MAKSKTNEFEKSFKKLESIVAKLEQEELSLDESLALFEEGIGLSRVCHTRLEEIESKIETILADAKGDAVVEAVDDGDGDGDDEEDEPVPF